MPIWDITKLWVICLEKALKPPCSGEYTGGFMAQAGLVIKTSQFHMRTLNLSELQKQSGHLLTPPYLCICYHFLSWDTLIACSRHLMPRHKAPQNVVASNHRNICFAHKSAIQASWAGTARLCSTWHRLAWLEGWGLELSKSRLFGHLCLLLCAFSMWHLQRTSFKEARLLTSQFWAPVAGVPREKEPSRSRVAFWWPSHRSHMHHLCHPVWMGAITGPHPYSRAGHTEPPSLCEACQSPCKNGRWELHLGESIFGKHTLHPLFFYLKRLFSCSRPSSDITSLVKPLQLSKIDPRLWQPVKAEDLVGVSEVWCLCSYTALLHTPGISTGESLSWIKFSTFFFSCSL